MLLRTVLAGAVVVAASFPPPASARPANCKLVVEGRTYIDGLCEFEADRDGSFRIVGDKYFAYVSVHGNKADASWNADPNSTHAQAPLGELTRKGACWVSRTVEICARNLDAGKRAEVEASRPAGEMIYPDVPGASQACIGTQDGRWEAGAALVLRNCRIPADKAFVRSADTISIDKRPGLCIEAVPAAGGKPARLVLKACSRASAKWRWDGDTLNGRPVRSTAGLCWNIPALMDANALFPFDVIAEPCSDATVKFFFAKD